MRETCPLLVYPTCVPEKHGKTGTQLNVVITALLCCRAAAAERIYVDGGVSLRHWQSV